jgi:O-acetyl-ADP-ribose deacetylase (regulator of RNase III)
LLEQRARVGHIAVLESEGRFIYYLVTKKCSNDKPFFDDLVSSLQRMRDHCAEHNVKHLAMPRIGCGLDRLEWRDVKPKIEEIFSGLDISITVYNFNQVSLRWPWLLLPFDGI